MIGLATLLVGEEYAHFCADGIKTKKAYCKKQGHPFLLETNWLDPSRPISWSKVKFLELHLASFDWLFYSDADSLIMNDAIALEGLIDNNYDLIITTDFNGINAGQFLIRNSSWSRAFFSKAYAMTAFINHPWWEQRAFLEILKDPKELKHVKIVPQRTFNAYFDNYQQGDFLIHFPSFNGLELFYVMQHFAELLRELQN
jgi:mannan polymerase II complex MNN10 subunit